MYEPLFIVLGLCLVIGLISILFEKTQNLEKEDGIIEVVKNKQEEKKEEVANNEVEKKKGFSTKAKLLFGFGIVAFFVVIFKADDWIYNARKVASYDWGYECGYITASIRVTENMETSCGKDRKYEYWGSERWRQGYRDGEEDGEWKTKLRENKLYCNQLECWE